jgi:hypothetical protein
MRPADSASARSTSIVVVVVLALLLGTGVYLTWSPAKPGGSAGGGGSVPAAAAGPVSVEVFTPYAEEITATLTTFREDGSVLSMSGHALPRTGAWKHQAAAGSRQRLEFRFTDDAIKAEPVHVDVGPGDACFTLRADAGRLTLEARDPKDRVINMEPLPR